MLNTQQLRRLAETQLNVPAMLHDYQWEGVAFLFKSDSALLADEMGLGKTVQTAVALALLLNSQSEINRVLIVAPASLTTNWMSELKAWVPSVTVRRVNGNEQDRRAHFLLPIPVLVSSYEQIRVDAITNIPTNTFDLVILDEAQRIKNRHSTTALACRILSRKRAWALSATPLENNQDDLVSILSFLNGSVGLNFTKPDLVQMLESMMLRRRKSEVRAELPPVIYQDLKLELSEPQRMVYEELWGNRLETIGQDTVGRNVSAVLLSIITRLKIICNFDAHSNTSSKLDALKAITESAGPSARILVFSQFVKTLRWISDRLKYDHDLLTGSMTQTERQTAINNFNSESVPRMLMVSLRAGGVGLNLGEATHVVLFDRWWNPAVEIQAIYRAHRFERTEPLHVIRFLVTDTVEERIATILHQKEQLFDATIESVDRVSHRFAREELMNILELSDGGLLSN